MVDHEELSATFQEAYARKQAMKRGFWLTTFTKQKFYPLDVEHSVIDIRDIAHALSLTNRFSGHSPEAYSVAQHSLHVAEQLPPDLQLWGLLHDAAEAYICDLPYPVKGIPDMQGYRSLESTVQQAICKAFGLSYPKPRSVKDADLLLLRAEAKSFEMLDETWDVYPLPDIGLKVVPRVAQVVEAQFLQMFYRITTRGI